METDMETFEFENETYHVANPYDGAYGVEEGRPLYRHAVLITVGIYASDKVIVFTDNSIDMCDICTVLEDALDALPSKDWDCAAQVTESYNDAIAEGKTEEEAFNASQEDVTAINGGSHYIAEWMCGGVTKELEDAARKHGLEILNGCVDAMDGN
jgi:hypothetical protein